MQTAQIQRRWKAGETLLGARRVIMAGLLLLLGLAAGWVAARYGLLLPLATLSGLAAAIFAFLFPWKGFLLAAAIAVLLPFGVLPVSLGLTPSFLELALLGFLGGWLLSPLLGGHWYGPFSVLDALAWAFFGLTLLSLTLGHGMTATILHNYGKFALGLLAFFGVRRLVHTRERLRQFLRLFLAAAGLAAGLGILLQALPDALAHDLLVGLGPLGYPTQGRVLRYVEDDPDGLERAIGTAVDPNSFGGMLAAAAAMALTPISLSPRSTRESGMEVNLPKVGVRVAPLLTCLYLTHSRAALGGFLVAAAFLATVRYRRLWWLLLAGILLLALLILGTGWSGPALERLRQGLFFQDLANRMRLAEFANALAIIGRYPTLGVGLGSAPDIDLSVGVSSLYLTISERMGLLGLFSFLAFIGVALSQGLRLACQEEERLALLAGAVSALSTGLLDHYFFNLEFPHMAFLLWGILGLATSVSQPLPSLPDGRAACPWTGPRCGHRGTGDRRRPPGGPGAGWERDGLCFGGAAQGESFGPVRADDRAGEGCRPAGGAELPSGGLWAGQSGPPPAGRQPDRPSAGKRSPLPGNPSPDGVQREHRPKSGRRHPSVRSGRMLHLCQSGRQEHPEGCRGNRRPALGGSFPWREFQAVSGR